MEDIACTKTFYDLEPKNTCKPRPAERQPDLAILYLNITYQPETSALKYRENLTSIISE